MTENPDFVILDEVADPPVVSPEMEAAAREQHELLAAGAEAQAAAGAPTETGD